jgi:amino acid transporter
MSALDTVFGRPLASAEEEQERVGPATGVAVFGLDALSSAAYGPEAAMTVLLPLGALGLGYVEPITVAILILLAMVYFSYRQTIAAYPSGGGSYTVARENLGQKPGLIAAAALMTDYVLNVAVGISAGVGALISAVPGLHRHTLTICLLILAFLTLVNLRGIREAGLIFTTPTYLFVVCLLGIIVWGAIATLASGGNPRPAVPPPALKAGPVAAGGLWLILRAFSSGCTAMTGVEAVSNGVQAFREPVAKNAQRTLTIMIAILAVLLAGIAWLVRVYHIGATEPGTSAYQSVLSQLIGAVAGKGAIYIVSMSSILAVLCLSANTSFSDFPRLCRMVAADSHLPYSFSNRGRRLVFSEGIWVLAALSGILLIIFGGVTDRLIPLFAVGAFLAFTLSQFGMVAHWLRKREGRWRESMFVNGLGGLGTAATVIVVVMAKFTEGAWVVVLLVPALIALMVSVRRHYDRVIQETAAPPRLDVNHLRQPIAVVPIERWNRISQKALRYALTVSDEIHAIHVECEHTDDLVRRWTSDVQEPARAAGRPEPKLDVMKSPYRFVVQPIADFVSELERSRPDRIICVIIPNLFEKRWYHYFLHNQRGDLLAARLLLGGERRIVIVQVPWYL